MLQLTNCCSPKIDRDTGNFYRTCIQRSDVLPNILRNRLRLITGNYLRSVRYALNHHPWMVTELIKMNFLYKPSTAPQSTPVYSPEAALSI